MMWRHQYGVAAFLSGRESQMGRWGYLGLGEGAPPGCGRTEVQTGKTKTPPDTHAAHAAHAAHATAHEHQTYITDLAHTHTHTHTHIHNNT